MNSNPPEKQGTRAGEGTSRKRWRDVDAAQRARLLQIAPWAGIGGGFGVVLAEWAGFSVLLGFLMGVAAVLLGGVALPKLFGRIATTIYMPSGRSTPATREYSYADSLAVRGRHEEAVTAYQAAAREFPDDPEPCFRLARLLRDDLARYEEALVWFKRARLAPGIDPGRELLATQEIIDIYLHRLGDRRRAIPELARLAEKLGDGPGAARVREQLAMLKAELAQEEGR